MKRNPGHLPDDAIGKRINGLLAKGRPFTNWAADGRAGCCWERRGTPFDIDQYEIRA